MCKLMCGAGPVDLRESRGPPKGLCPDLRLEKVVLNPPEGPKGLPEGRKRIFVQPEAPGRGPPEARKSKCFQPEVRQESRAGLGGVPGVLFKGPRGPL